MEGKSVLEGAGRAHQARRPYLDGLRCIAVFLVLAFHAGLSGFSGGFVGVDMFFVLSGFLVTRLLLDDLSAIHRVNFRRFYSRRVRRILPAACVTLVITAVAYARVASPAQMLDSLGGFRASFLYYANWYFIHQSVDYFAPNVNSSPVLHFWSLAVEEQYYLLWPLALTGLFVLARRAGRMKWWVLRLVIGSAALASLIAAVHISETNLDRAYYGTDTRAYQLLAGALLALTPQLFRLRGQLQRGAHWTAGIALAGLVLVGTSAIDVGPITRGILVVGLTGLLIVALENASTGVVARGLSITPIAYLGILSYGIYLWHWPIDVIATYNHDVSPITLFVLSSVLATALAAASYHFLERPIRAAPRLNRYRIPVVAAGLGVSMIGALVLAPAILEPHASASASGATLLDWRAAQKDRVKVPDCVGQPLAKCTIVKGTGARVVLIGDSNARMWVPAFEEISRKESWTFSVAVRPRCPWPRDVQYASDTGGERRDCAEHQADWYDRTVPDLNPDIVFLVQQAVDAPRFHPALLLPDGTRGTVDTPGVEAELERAAGDSVRALQRPGRRIVIMEPIPITPGADPISCLSEGGPAGKCEYRTSATPTPLERFYRSLTAPASVVSLDPDRLVCPRLPICDPIVHDIIVKLDRSHLTATYARFLSTAIDEELHRRGVIGGR